MLQICWFSTGRDDAALELFKEALSATKTKKIDGKISLCFINREIGESETSDRMIKLVRSEKIPLETLSTNRFLNERGLSLKEGRMLFDEEVLRRIEKYRFDLIFLAGYMLIVSPVLFERFQILNLHPSLPGKYKGKWEDVIRKIIENGERSFGAMIHLVTERLDEGPPVTYCKLTIDEEEYSSLYEEAKRGNESSYKRLFMLIRERELTIELPLVIETLSALSRGNIEIKGKRVYMGKKEVKGGVDLTEIIVGKENA